MSTPCRPCREGQHHRCLRNDGATCPCARGVCRRSVVPAAKASTTGASATMAVAMIPISTIDAGLNVRLSDDTGLAGLADSIRQHGILQPITVVPTVAGSQHECLFGHRRLAAARLAGLTEVPCIVRKRESGDTRVLIQVAENLKRKDMSVLEEALAFAELARLGMTQTAIAENVGMHSTDVNRRLQLLRYPEVVRLAVHRRNIYIRDALSIPLDIAVRTDGRTLAAILRRGSAAMREWLRQETADGSTPMTRRTSTAVGIDVHLYDEVKRAAGIEKVTLGEWVADACRARLKERAA